MKVILTKESTSSTSPYDDGDDSVVSASASASASVSPSQSLRLNIPGLLLVCTTPMLGGLLYGMDIGVTSFVLSMLLSSSSSSSSSTSWWWTDLSSIQQGLIVSAISLGALVGSHVVLMYLSTRIGRRMELRLSALCYLVGTALNFISGTVFSSTTTVPAMFGFITLLMGRLIFGIGVGFVMHGAPAYLAEMVPAGIRGAVVSFKETVIVGGIVIGYIIGNAGAPSSSSSSHGDASQWAYLYIYTGWVAFPMLLLTFWIPRSKRWLILHGLHKEAYESMKFVYCGCDTDIRNNFDRLVDSARPPVEWSQSSSGKEQNNTKDHEPYLLDPRYRKSVIASMGLIIFQQCSGQPSVLSYATVLFQAAGWSGNASVVTSILMMATSMSTVLLIERVGRKRLLCACCAIMVIALSALSITFWDWDGSEDDGGSLHTDSSFTNNRQVIILVAMFVYIGGYQLGFGPITWTIVSEVFPIEIRGTAIAAGVELNYGLNFAVQFIFPIVQDLLGWGPSFCMFGSILAFAFFFVQACVPETTGMTLEEIQAQMMNGNGHHDISQTLTVAGCDGESTSASDLLTRVNSSTYLLGGVFNIDEMETQLIRKHSHPSLAKKTHA